MWLRFNYRRSWESAPSSCTYNVRGEITRARTYHRAISIVTRLALCRSHRCLRKAWQRDYWLGWRNWKIARARKPPYVRENAINERERDDNYILRGRVIIYRLYEHAPRKWSSFILAIILVCATRSFIIDSCVQNTSRGEVFRMENRVAILHRANRLKSLRNVFGRSRRHVGVRLLF